jgi:hypothetical protein
MVGLLLQVLLICVDPSPSHLLSPTTPHNTTLKRPTVDLPKVKHGSQNISAAETFERSPRCRIARDSRIRPQNRSQSYSKRSKIEFYQYFTYIYRNFTYL